MRQAGKAMASMGAAIKSLAALALGLWACTATNAATFHAKRGLNLDIWTTWPDESRWGERDAILPFPEWRRTLDAAGLEELRSAGFDFVRMPVDPSPFLSPVSADLRPELIRSVVDSVQLVNGAGLKAIVDLHLFAAGSNRSIGMGEVMEDAALFDRYLDVVRDIGRAIGREDPAQVAFELMNEPTQGCEGAEQRDWEERLLKLFAAARASATRLTLVLSGSCWGSAEGLAALDPAMVPDDNVIWSFHSYAPFLLTHQGATWTGDFIPHVTGLPYPPHAVPRAELEAAVDRVRETIRRDAPWSRRSGLLSYLDELLAEVDTKEKLDALMGQPFETVAAWASKNGVAASDIQLGEFGMIRQEYGTETIMPADQRAAYYRDMIALADRHGFAWSMWGYGGAFGVVESFEGKRAEPDVLDMVRSLKK